ncbi:MAG: UvrD-helicase domain-containing protein [Coriobacteriia bacterium]
MEASLSDEQRQILDPAVRVVEAGPGSGKTRALISRFIAAATSSSKGVALLSFTNSAVDEARRRCGSMPNVLRSPHFVGTFDSFLHRFIVTPQVAEQLGKLPTYLASWDDLGPRTRCIHVPSVPGSGVRLSNFHFTLEGQLRLEEQRLSWAEAGWLSNVRQKGEEATLLAYARSRLSGLDKSGIYDSGSARLAAYRTLSGAAGDTVVARLCERFGEVLVDEAQDCDDAEIAIVRRLEAAGIQTVAVADPDQAIFEFRGGEPSIFLDYRDSCEAVNIVNLTTNYRSTQSVCKAISALRCACQDPVLANDTGVCCPVYVFAGAALEQRDKFLAVLSDAGLTLDDAVVLSHGRKDAQAAAGGLALAVTSDAMGNRLAIMCNAVRRSDDPIVRRKAITGVEDAILSLFDWPDDLKRSCRSNRLDALNRDSAWLRQSAARFVAGLGEPADASAFGVAARSVLNDILAGLAMEPVAVHQHVKKPTEDIWAGLDLVPAASMLRFDTIHGAKGKEFPAVLIALPDSLRKTDGRTVLDDWAAGFNTEPRRVLYVGASRAQRLLAFGAGPHATEVAEMLIKAGVDVKSM